MKNKILHSVIEITQNRDLDSLEYSLVATMAELVPISEITLFKTPRNNKPGIIDKVLQLTVNSNDTKESPFVWGNVEYSVAIDQQLAECIKSSKTIALTDSGNLSRLLIPIIADDHIMSILSICSDSNLLSFRPLIEGFVKIYTNYIIVLNESERDKLTGLYNRRTFDNKLQKLFADQKCKAAQFLASDASNNRRQEHIDDTAWLVIFDIDHFKRVNDEYGHVFGDEVILTVSQKMKQCFRSTDLMFRIGGDELIIIIEPSSFDVATTLIDDLRKTIANHDFSQIGTVTISMGYAKITERDYPPTILESADKALYYAKENGRNCIYNYELLVENGALSPPKRSGSVDLF